MCDWKCFLRFPLFIIERTTLRKTLYEIDLSINTEKNSLVDLICTVLVSIMKMLSRLLNCISNLKSTIRFDRPCLTTLTSLVAFNLYWLYIYFYQLNLLLLLPSLLFVNLLGSYFKNLRINSDSVLYGIIKNHKDLRYEILLVCSVLGVTSNSTPRVGKDKVTLAVFRWNQIRVSFART